MHILVNNDYCTVLPKEGFTLKKLYKSSFDRQFCGVCGGIAEYFGVDSTIVRLIWAFLTLCSCGTGLVLYLGAALIIPDDPNNPTNN